jgi:cytochrome c-type biogenesis protein CcmH
MSAAGPSQGANYSPSGGSAAAQAASVGAHFVRRLALLLLIAAVALSPLVALAADAVPTEKDAVAAQRAVKLSEKLRCLVCQNQTIADSNAELAQDLRRQIHEQIAAGKSDGEIVDFMVARYGDFVLYQPPVKPTTVLLWAGPALLLLLGFFGLARILRARRAQVDAPPLTAEEHERAAQLLAGDKVKDNS